MICRPHYKRPVVQLPSYATKPRADDVLKPLSLAYFAGASLQVTCLQFDLSTHTFTHAYTVQFVTYKHCVVDDCPWEMFVIPLSRVRTLTMASVSLTASSAFLL